MARDTHNDRKPLTISITDGDNGFVYSAKKAGLLWLTGNVSVCRSGGVTEITLKNTQATSNVPMLARLALPSTQSAHIVNDQIQTGRWRMGRNLHWSIIFVCRAHFLARHGCEEAAERLNVFSIAGCGHASRPPNPHRNLAESLHVQA
jgi:hypothetical protein